MADSKARLSWRVFFLGALLCGCQTVEYTGRSQVNLVSEGDEKKLGVDAYQDILKKTPVSKNQAWQAQLKRVGQRISAAAAKPDYQWEFNVLEGKEINAFCLPGGKVVEKYLSAEKLYGAIIGVLVFPLRLPGGSVD